MMWWLFFWYFVYTWRFYLAAYLVVFFAIFGQEYQSTAFLQYLVSLGLWVWSTASLSMCLYCLMASGEGWRWFKFTLTPYLITSALAGVLTYVVYGYKPPREALLLTSVLWSAFAFTITVKHWELKIWDQIVPVNSPLVALTLLYYAI